MYVYICTVQWAGLAWRLSVRLASRRNRFESASALLCLQKWWIMARHCYISSPSQLVKTLRPLHRCPSYCSSIQHSSSSSPPLLSTHLHPHLPDSVLASSSPETTLRLTIKSKNRLPCCRHDGGYGDGLMQFLWYPRPHPFREHTFSEYVLSRR